MNTLIALALVITNIGSQPSNGNISPTYKLRRDIVAQNTCGMAHLREMENKFPKGTIVNDGYSNFKVINYSPSFAAVLVRPVDSQGNELSQTNYWRCLHILKTGKV